MTEELLSCYNKGCGKQYKEIENTETSCRHHPGGPIFHDALKGWSCCKKRTCDFTEFLSIPGCTAGYHSNAKSAQQPPTNQNQSKKGDEKCERVVPVKPSMERPPSNEKMLKLPMTISDSLKKALDHQSEDANEKTPSQLGVISTGTNCKNNGCSMTYTDEDSNFDACIHHPGVPIFHEGMKYWSCCKVKTSDFNSFLSQEGCASGKHLWTKKEEEETNKSRQTACRYDWHQTASFVTITIFSKHSLPDRSVLEANKVLCKVSICFDKGRKVFNQDFKLKGVIDVERSNVMMMESKVEVNLRKMEAGNWSCLQLPL